MKTFINWIKNIIIFLLSTTIYLIEVALLIILSINSILSYRTINSLLQNIEVKEILTNIESEKKILQNIYDGAYEIGISEETIDSLLELKEIKNLLARYISAGTKYIIHGSASTNITVANIIDEAKKDFDDIVKNNEIDLSIDKRENIEEAVNNIITKLKEELPEIKELNIELEKDTLKIIRTIFRYETILILILSIIVLTLLIALLKKSFVNWMINLSIITTFASLIGIVVAIVPLFDFTSIIPNLPKYILTLISSGVQIICNNFLIIGIIYLIIGISLITLYYAYKKKIGEKKEH